MYYQSNPSEIFRERHLALLRETDSRRLARLLGARREPQHRSKQAMMFGFLAALMVAGIMLVALSGPARAAPATFTVNSTKAVGDGTCDASECTLQEATDTASFNGNPQQTDLITFNIPGAGPHTIMPIAEQFIDEPVIIDGYTQPGASPNTLTKGTNAKIMIELDGSNAGSSTGLYVQTRDVVIRGLAINNFASGGVEIQGPAQNNIKVEGNFIGTDPSGTQDLGNGDYGVEIIFGSGLTVGGATPAARNLISGNKDHGLELFDTTGNTISGNLIGTKSDGTSAMGNTGSGVSIESASGNLIGGGTPASANTIAFNTRDGVAILDLPVGTSSASNRIFVNSIFSNGQEGIDLGGDGPTTNDIVDPDLGPNHLQNYPVLTSVRTSRKAATVNGTLNGTPNAIFVVQLFSNPRGRTRARASWERRVLPRMHLATPTSASAPSALAGW